MAKSIAKQTLSLGALALWALTASPLSYAKSEKRKPARFYAVGARIDGAVAFDMASLAEKDGLRSLRVWEFSPTPVATTDGFKAGSVQTIEFDCSGGRVRFIDRGIFAALDKIEPQPDLSPQWFAYHAPKGNPDASLSTTAWLLLCRGTVPASWVAYDDLVGIALDYWSSLGPARDADGDAHAVRPPTWAGANAAEPTGPQPPKPVIPW